MRKTIILRLFLLIALGILLYSCIHDDISAPSDPSLQEYTNKSLWKEDEKYIRNVKRVFEEYSDENYFTTNFGTVYWDYALTMGTFDESFLEVPVIKNGKVNFILVVYREEDRVYFKRKDDRESKEFFSVLVFKNRDQLKGRVLQNPSSDNNAPNKGALCYTVEVTWTWTNDDGSPGGTYNYNETRCGQTGPYLPCTSLEANGNCGGSTGGGNGSGGGGTGSGSGYPYYPSQAQNACARIKADQAKAKYTEKYNALNKPEIFNMDKERGFYELQPPKGVVAQSGYVQIDGPPGTTGLKLPNNTDRISGLFHSHNNVDGSIKVFSPTDVKTFINIFLKNAREYAGGYSEAYSTVVTSEGSYTLKYTKDTHPGGINYDTGQRWDAWYKENMKRIQNEDGEFDQEKVEAVFSRFLSEVVNIDGLEVYKVTALASGKMTYNPANPLKANVEPCPTNQ